MGLIMILLVLPILFLFLLQKHRSKSLRLPPGPKGLPIIGNLHRFDASNPHIYIWKLSKQFGPLVSLRLGSVPVLVISSAEMAKEVMKTHDLLFCSRPTKVSHKKISYNYSEMALTPYNEHWREMRKICVIHLFNSIRVQRFRPVREDQVSCMIEKISKSSVASEPVNLSEVIMGLTSTIICSVAFGKRYKDEGIANKELHALLDETQAVFGAFFFSDYFPFMGWADMLTGKFSALERNFKKCDTYYQELIDEHLDPKRPKTEQEDIIDVLLRIQKEGGCKIDLTLDHIKGVIMDIFVGGTETIAASVIWAMTCLMKTPKAMKKAQEEVRCLVENKGFVDEDDILKLSYLESVVKETMRLHPVLPLMVPRESLENCYLDKYEIPAKTVVFVNVWAMGRDPKVWKNPNEFYPERFIEHSIDIKGQNFELIPFGAGRRSCPGMYMAITTVQLVLANLIYKFDWAIPVGMTTEDLDFDSETCIVMHKKNVLCLMAKNYI